MNFSKSLVTAAIFNAAGLLALGCTEPVDSEESDGADLEATEEASSELLNGTTTTAFAPVVRIQSDTSLCTATAIADDLLITAAHCVKKGTAVTSSIQVTVAHGANAAADGARSSYIVMSADIYDNENIGSTVTTDFIKRDFAFIKFGAGTFSSYYDTSMVTGSLNGTTVRLLGFGGSETKAYGDEPVTGTTLGSYGYITTSQSSGGNLEHGDSGGPVLVASGSTYVVVGVNSAINSVNASHPILTSALGSYILPVLATLPDACVESYKDASFGGDSWSFCDESAIGADLADTTFSDPYKIEEHGDFDLWNDEITGLKLPAGTAVTVFEHANAGGSSLTFQNVFPFGNVASLGSLSSYSFNDKISSASVTAVTSPSDARWLLEITRHGKCIDVANGGPGDGAKVQQWDCQKGNTNQLFELEAVGSYYQIKHTASGKCLDVFNAYTTAGTAIQLWTCNGGGNQLFSISSNTSTSNARDFKLVGAASGKCLDLSSGASANATQIQIWGCDSSNTSQNFALKLL